MNTFREFVSRWLGKKSEPEKIDDSSYQCCSERVHIAYRGISDDRLYLAQNRKISEIKFFKPNGLRVFCAECRRRIV